jgi:hypothetical protein
LASRRGRRWRGVTTCLRRSIRTGVLASMTMISCCWCRHSTTRAPGGAGAVAPGARIRRAAVGCAVSAPPTIGPSMRCRSTNSAPRCGGHGATQTGRRAVWWDASARSRLTGCARTTFITSAAFDTATAPISPSLPGWNMPNRKRCRRCRNAWFPTVPMTGSTGRVCAPTTAAQLILGSRRGVVAAWTRRQTLTYGWNEGRSLSMH